ncbi:hypothetical protein Btru_018590 [Bulinus truncatus]|nr:hypothetical protein Btru_018590 [Bulinus truncatus]
MAGGSRKSHKELLQKFKSKVIAKLFGNRDNADINPNDHSDVDEDTNVASSSSTLSGLDLEYRARQVRLYGAQCCPTGSKHGNHVNEPVHMVGSSSYLSDDEDSDSISAPKRYKRKITHTCSEAFKQAQLAASSSSSSSQTDQQIQESTSTKLSRNKKRKLKKKKKEQDKKIRKHHSTEFFFDSSSNNNSSHNKVMSTDKKEEHLKTVKEFLEAIWEIYSAQNLDKDCAASEFDFVLQKLEQCKSEDLLLMFSVMSTLVLSNQEKGLKKIEQFQKKTSLNTELKTFITKLFIYWTTEVIEVEGNI